MNRTEAWRLIRPWIGRFLIAGSVLPSLGCAYFNTMHNAKSAFKQAESSRGGKDGAVSGAQRQYYQETIKKCEKLLTRHPNSKWADDALYMLALSKYRLGLTEEAVDYFEQFMEAFPNSNYHEQALFSLAEVYLADGEPERSVATLDQFREQYTKSKLYDQVYLLQGDILFHKEEYDRCIEAYNLLLEKFPKSKERVKARERIGESERARGRYESSLEQYRLILLEDLDPEEQFEARWQVAKNLADLGRHEEALAEYAKLDGESVLLQMHMSMLVDRASSEVGIADYDSALATLSIVTRKIPRSELAAEAWYMKGEIYQNNLENMDEAIKAFDEVGRQYRRGDYPRLALKRSADIKRMKKLKLRLAAKGGDTSPEAQEALAEAQFLLAEVSLEQYEDPARAIGEYQKVLDVYPESEFAPRAAYAIIWIYWKKLAQPDLARQAYEVLKRRYPESVQAETAGEMLGIPEQSAHTRTTPWNPEGG